MNHYDHLENPVPDNQCTLTIDLGTFINQALNVYNEMYDDEDIDEIDTYAVENLAVEYAKDYFQSHNVEHSISNKISACLDEYFAM